MNTSEIIKDINIVIRNSNEVDGHIAAFVQVLARAQDAIRALEKENKELRQEIKEFKKEHVKCSASRSEIGNI